MEAMFKDFMNLQPVTRNPKDRRLKKTVQEIDGAEEKCGKRIAEVTFKYFMNSQPTSRNLEDRSSGKTLQEIDGEEEILRK